MHTFFCAFICIHYWKTLKVSMIPLHHNYSVSLVQLCLKPKVQNSYLYQVFTAARVNTSVQ